MPEHIELNVARCPKMLLYAQPSSGAGNTSHERDGAQPSPCARSLRQPRARLRLRGAQPQACVIRRVVWACMAGALRSCRARLIQPLHSQRAQRAIVFELNTQSHRTATHLAVLDILLRAGAQINARLKALAAIWAGCGHKLLGCDPRALRRRLKDRLKSVEVVDMTGIETFNPSCEGFEFRILATRHGHSFYTPADSRAEANLNEVVAVNAALPRQRLLACTVLCAMLGACGGAGRLSADAPSGVDLAGTWKLNRGLSDDPEKLYEKFRLQRAQRNGEQIRPAARRGGPRSGGADSAAYPAEDPNDPGSAEFQGAANRSRLNPYELGVFGTIPRGDVVTIRQRADEMYIFDGLADRSFTPGAQSVVSVPEGVADQHSGWKAKAYVIDVKAQAGPETIERYHLSADGKQLVAEIQSNGGNMASMKIKRVYDRVSAAASAAPTND
jgi:hypothetical protein